MNYTITLSETELDLVHDDLAKSLGRMLNPKPVTVRKPAAPRRRVYPAKPPRLNDRAFASVAHRWAEACVYPQRWRNDLQYNASRATNRNYANGDVARAWGLDPVTGL